MEDELGDKAWQAQRVYTPEKLALARQALDEIRHGRKVIDVVRRYPLPDGGHMGKHLLVAAYYQAVEIGDLLPDSELLARIRMKPVRTLSGVTTVTVLTKPYPCPGKCVFCPTDARMPKSYLPDEPGARRALQHCFDPFDQVAGRIEALESIGHPVDKIELLILGGTWNAYQRNYQQWFVQRCLDAMNGFKSHSLEDAQLANDHAAHRNVGLVIETRPDHVKPAELVWLRRLGVTKVQVGVQSLDDHILEINQRGHTVDDTKRAVALLRAAGFKIVLHWMPNLLGATLASDKEDFSRLWQGICPDEIKIYPSQLLANADLYKFWLQGEYKPYSTQELINLIADIKPTIPRYCRVNRIIRDIPSTNVVEGNKRTSLRQDVHQEMQRRGTVCHCVRCREVRSTRIYMETLEFVDEIYQADNAEEHFLSFVTPEDQLAGFLRLSLPRVDAPKTGIEELQGAALIREVHVYGQSLPVGTEKAGAAQHSGIGTRLLENAIQIAHQHNYARVAVISAIGTRSYYKQRGFDHGDLYLLHD